MCSLNLRKYLLSYVYYYNIYTKINPSKNVYDYVNVSFELIN